MSKTTRKNKNSKKHNRRSMKGKWGKVGAPPKATKFPSGVFTIESLHNRNKNQCKLSIRKKVEAAEDAGTLIRLKARKQAGGSVGRPSAAFILKENFDASKHEKGERPAPLNRKPRTAPVVSTSATVTPAAPVVTAPAPEPVAATVVPPPAEAPVETAPVVSETVTEPANVIQAPIETTPVPAPVEQAA